MYLNFVIDPFQAGSCHREMFLLLYARTEAFGNTHRENGISRPESGRSIRKATVRGDASGRIGIGEHPTRLLTLPVPLPPVAMLPVPVRLALLTLPGETDAAEGASGQKPNF